MRCRILEIGRNEKKESRKIQEAWSDMLTIDQGTVKYRKPKAR